MGAQWIADLGSKRKGLAIAYTLSAFFVIVHFPDERLWEDVVTPPCPANGTPPVGERMLSSESRMWESAHLAR